MSGAKVSVWRQPAQVWAVAFACVIAFMGIGLVDPILPAIAESLEASPVETELLFTSYLVVTGLAMLVTSWISSRIGTKATLLTGLALIVVFALLCALSGSVDAVIGFRAGWGLGNALFISTALATIVGAASGGSAAAIILYEAALGLGIAIGPLLGGILGEISWRGPFFGVVALMAIAFIAVLALLRGPREQRTPVPFSAPFRALRHPALATLAIAALFYNIGFFTLLAFSPFPLGFGAMGIGLTFFGWGIALAITSVWAAPWLLGHFSRTGIILVVLPLLALDLVAAARQRAAGRRAPVAAGPAAVGEFGAALGCAWRVWWLGAEPKLLPPPGRAASSRPPPWRAAIARTIEMPRPAPAASGRPASPRQNRWPACAICATVMPGPRSAIVIRHVRSPGSQTMSSSTMLSSGA